MYDNLTPTTIEECISTLRYLKREYDQGFRIDAINMAHVEKALMRVDIELSIQRAERNERERISRALIDRASQTPKPNEHAAMRAAAE